MKDRDRCPNAVESLIRTYITYRVVTSVECRPPARKRDGHGGPTLLMKERVKFQATWFVSRKYTRQTRAGRAPLIMVSHI